MRYILTFLLVFLSSSILLSQNGDSRSKDSVTLLPVKLTRMTPVDSTETFIDYDDLMRITKVKTIFYNKDKTMRLMQEQIVDYDDEAYLYRTDNFYVVSALTQILTNYASTEKSSKEIYYFNYEQLSPSEVRIDKKEDYSTTSYSVDSESGQISLTEVYNFNHGGMSYSRTFDYDSVGNLSKLTLVDFRARDGYIASYAYGNQKGMYSAIKTPQWFMLEELLLLPSFGFVNSNIETVVNDACDTKVESVYEYNEDGFPIRYKTCFSQADSSQGMCASPGTIDYVIDYISVEK